MRNSSFTEKLVMLCCKGKHDNLSGMLRLNSSGMDAWNHLMLVKEGQNPGMHLRHFDWVHAAVVFDVKICPPFQQQLDGILL